MDPSKNGKSIIGVLLGCAGAITTGIFGIFFNYFDSVGLSEGGKMILTPFLVFVCFLVIVLIKNPRELILKSKLFYFTIIGLSGAFLYSFYNFAYVKAIESLPLAITSLFNFSNALVLVFLMRIFFKEKITIKKIVCCVLSIIGILFVLEIFSGGNQNITSTGIFWGMSVTVALAFSYTVDYFHVKKGIPFYVIQVYSCFGAMVVYSFKYSVFDLFKELSEINSEQGSMLWIVLLLYFINVAISYGATTASYNFIDASYTSITYVLEPTVAAIAGFFLFGEMLSTVQIIGMVISVSAIIYMQYSESRGSQKIFKRKKYRFKTEKPNGKTL